MTSRLAAAFELASHLPDQLQNTIAEELIAEIEGEAEFDRLLESSPALLESLIREAKKEVADGNFSTGDWEQR